MKAGPRNGRIRKRVRWRASSTVRRPSGRTSRVAITRGILAGPNSLADQTQVREVPVPLAELEAVPDEELVRDREADVPDGQVVDEPPVGAAEQRGDVEGGGAAQRERPDEVVHRQAGVDDGVGEHDVAALDLRVEVLQEPDAAVAVGVAGELDEVEMVEQLRAPGEVADERDTRLQRADQQGLAAGVVALELGADLPDAPPDLVSVEEDLADALVDVPQDAQDAFLRPYRAASRSKSRS